MLLKVSFSQWKGQMLEDERLNNQYLTITTQKHQILLQSLTFSQLFT